jgi:hypothetical protein
VSATKPEAAYQCRSATLFLPGEIKGEVLLKPKTLEEHTYVGRGTCYFYVFLLQERAKERFC